MDALHVKPLYASEVAIDLKYIVIAILTFMFSNFIYSQNEVSSCDSLTIKWDEYFKEPYLVTYGESQPVLLSELDELTYTIQANDSFTLRKIACLD